MSTRCNILLHSPDGARVYFYRHSDGDPSAVLPRLQRIFSASLAKTSDGYPWIGDIATRILNAHDEEGDPLYCLTSGPHRDINYFYAVELPGFKSGEDYHAYSRNRSLVKFRFASGFGAGLEAAALASTPLSFDELHAAALESDDDPT